MMQRGCRIFGCGLLLALAAVQASCGGGASSEARSQTIVRVGYNSITAATLVHWIAVLAPQHRVSEPPHHSACIARLQRVRQDFSRADLYAECELQHEELKRHALDFLISADWLAGAAAERGVGVTRNEVERRLAQTIRSFPNGRAEFERSLQVLHHALADFELETEAELASAKLRASLTKGEPPVTHAQVAAYYTRHRSRYRISERRSFDMVQTVRAEADGRRHVEEAIHRDTIYATREHESLLRSEVTVYHGGEPTALNAVFAARPHVLVGPIVQDGHFYMFVVTRIVPSRLEPLASVASSIAEQLASSRRQRALARFAAAWRTTWMSKTDCAAGYVVQKCRQYKGPMGAEGTLELE